MSGNGKATGCWWALGIGVVVLVAVGGMCLYWQQKHARLASAHQKLQCATKQAAQQAAERSTAPIQDLPTTARFANQVVLVTGGTSGIGLATAKAFVQAGAARVIVCSRRPAVWQSLELTPREQHVMVYRQCDVRVEAQVSDLLEEVFKAYGRLDIAFNNAGVACKPAPVDEQVLTNQETTADIQVAIPAPETSSTDSAACPVAEQTGTSPFCENSLFTDGMGVFYCLKHEVRLMRQHMHQYPLDNLPRIVNTASVNAFWGSPGSVLYGASKGMALLLTRGVAGEQATQKTQDGHSLAIRVNCIAPGPVDTALLRAQVPNPTLARLNKLAGTGVPLGRVASPAEVAQSVLFLADNRQASYITGACLTVDGGLTAAPAL